MHSQIRTSFDLSSVDFDNVDVVTESASQMLASANELGLFMTQTSRQSVNARRFVEDATVWISNVRKQIDVYPIGKALALIDVYDLLHRVTYLRPADRGFINGIILKALEARIHGDRSVDEYVLYRAIRSGIGRKDKAFFDRPLQWLCLTEESWYNEATKGYDRSRLSDYDILNRAAILLETDLFAFEGSNQTAFKHRLLNSTRHYLDNYTAPDPKTHLALNRYLSTSANLSTLLNRFPHSSTDN